MFLDKLKFKPSSERQKTQFSDEDHQCKNCDTEFKGHYCPQCGQSVKEFDKPFSFLIIDLAGNIFAFDTRLWKTLITILFKPGKLTLDFMAGKRARYMPPFRLYVFVSFAFFLLLSILINRNVKTNSEDQKILNQKIEEIEHHSIVNDTLMNLGDTLDLKSFLPGTQIILDKEEDYENEKLGLVMRAIRLVTANPAIYINRLLKYFSWSLFFMMPIYGLLLWLFYFKNRRYYFSHLLLAVNQHAFFFMVLTVMLAIHLVWPGREHYPENFLVIAIPLNHFLGLRKVYQEKFLRTILKLFVIVFIYSTLLMFSIFGIFLFYFWVEFI